jgi:hypothetical protein
MTKNTIKKENNENKPTSQANKEILYELVSKSEERDSTIAGTLSKNNLLRQYEQEKIDFPKGIVKPTLTEFDFNKMIKEFKEAK